MNQQGYVATPPYSQSQPGIGGFTPGFGQPASSPLYGHYGDVSPSPSAPQSAMLKTSVPFGPAAPVGSSPPAIHQFNQASFQNGPSNAAQQSNRYPAPPPSYSSYYPPSQATYPNSSPSSSAVQLANRLSNMQVNSYSPNNAQAPPPPLTSGIQPSLHGRPPPPQQAALPSGPPISPPPANNLNSHCSPPSLPPGARQEGIPGSSPPNANLLQQQLSNQHPGPGLSPQYGTLPKGNSINKQMNNLLFPDLVILIFL